ncbi:glutaredoxin family protein [Candidatus Alkanophaga liquidiphilum]|nr:Glutaredoxin [Candidatus Alkanophaga liquidiphilum]RLG38841.1 MAG: NrdH-redoxin [Candidatus Alkanophagales archaeon]
MKVRVYTTERCPNCELLKKFLAAKGVRYEEVDMTTAEALTELRLHGVFTLTAPVLQVGEKFLTYADIFEGGELKKKRILDALDFKAKGGA